MPRGKPGTGPNARKRLQRVLQSVDEEYMRLALSEEETCEVYDALTEAAKKAFGTTKGFHLTNVTYRITEFVMLEKRGLPRKEPPKPRVRPKRKS